MISDLNWVIGRVRGGGTLIGGFRGDHGVPRVLGMPTEASQFLADARRIGDGGVWCVLAGGVDEDFFW